MTESELRQRDDLVDLVDNNHGAKNEDQHHHDPLGKAAKCTSSAVAAVIRELVKMLNLR